MIRSKLLISLATAALLLLPSSLLAQGTPPVGTTPNVQITAAGGSAVLIQNTLQTPTTKTYEFAPQNTQWRGITCTSLWTVSSGSPSEVFSIEGFDAATAAWYPIGTTGTIANAAVPQTLTIYPGVAVSSLSTGMVAQNAMIPRRIRLKDVIGTGVNGAGPAVTSKIGCNYLK